MELKRVPARFYRTAAGREAAREWLKDVPAEDRRIVGEDVRDIAQQLFRQEMLHFSNLVAPQQL